MYRSRYLWIFYILVIALVSCAHPFHSQENDLKKAKLLSQQVEKHYQQGRYAEAVPIAEKVLAIKEKALGPEHLDVALSLNNLAALYNSLGDYAKALPLYKRALTIKEKALSPKHPDVATTLHNLALVYDNLGNFAKALPLHKRALTISEEALGPEHPDVATSLNGLAGHFYSLGDYDKAEPLYKRVLAIDEKNYDPEHPDVALTLNNLAILYHSLGDYSKAEPLFKRALDIREKALGPEHPDVAKSLNYLAVLYHSLGDYSKAEPLLKRALTISEAALGPEHPDVAESLSNLAVHYDNLGNFAKALPLYKRVLSIDEKNLGPEHPHVARSLNNLAAFYYSLGDHSKAEPLFKRALTISEKALGPEHPQVATCLNNLAAFYDSLGDYAKAEPLFKRVLDIREKTLGPGHPDVALSLNNLAIFYISLGDHSKAEPLFKRALTISEKALGPEHPDVALSLNNLAGLYCDLGDFAKAVPLHKRALTIKEKALGPGHPEFARSLNNLAASYAALNEFEKSHNILKRAQDIDDKLIDQVMGFTSEDQKIKFLSTKKWGLYAFLSLVHQHLAQSPSARKDAFNVWLKRKGVILEAQRRFQEALVYSDNPQAIKDFQKLSKVRAQLSKLAFSGPGKQGLEAYKKKITDLEAQKERLEAKLSQLSQAFALKQKIAKADCEKVAATLPADTLLIEFARVEMYNFKAKGKEKSWNPAHYLAFVLHEGKGDKVGMIDLGDAEKIDKAVAKFKKEISNIRDIKAAKAIKSSRKIYDLVFAPLRKEIGEVKEIFISPDGNLNLIPFEVLQGPDGRHLIEDYTLNYLAAGRDVLGFGQIKDKGGKALLMGDPDFDMGAEEKSSTLRRLALSVGKEEEISRRSLEMRDFHFTRIPGTREEVKAIQRILGEDKAELYTGKEALEEVLRQRKTPSILHLATHGFFLSDLELGDLAHDTTGRSIKVVMSPKAKIKRGKIENPLLRSGIALAGANNALESGDAEKSDGIVTAEKILGLRLRGTDMVVLSACETGLGEVKTGEGVFGLRRAFSQAGARSMVMSMWAVPDRETNELMVEFYRNIISAGMNRCQALRRAALKEMKIIKERYGHTNPFFWGAFVFMGEP